MYPIQDLGPTPEGMTKQASLTRYQKEKVEKKRKIFIASMPTLHQNYFIEPAPNRFIPILIP
jgi:hypothetical protein